ncbi:hypothetical protein ABB02_01479 [Clostridiaceae bacterium JG1575]|nr:hypothetical protein ABB02_01479 [Clostridiaceae bacterium JG1575]
MELIVDGLYKSFGEKEVLCGASHTFKQGKIYGLLGRNGAGKTTLFNLIAREESSDDGLVELCRDGRCALLENEDYTYLYATPTLPDFLTGMEFLRLFQDIVQENKARSHTAHPWDPLGQRPVSWYLDRLKFPEEDALRLIKHYSHGMKNKLQMMMFLISGSPVILLDEPLTALDIVAAREIKELLRSIRSEHIILFSTHILALAQELCDEIVLLHGGRLEPVDSSLIRTQEFEEMVVSLLTQGEAKGSSPSPCAARK